MAAMAVGPTGAGEPQQPPPTTARLPTRRLHVLAGHQGAVHAVRFTGTSAWRRPRRLSAADPPLPAGDGAFCVSAGSDGTVRLWNPHRGALLKTYAGVARTVLDVVAYAGERRCSRRRCTAAGSVTGSRCRQVAGQCDDRGRR